MLIHIDNIHFGNIRFYTVLQGEYFIFVYDSLASKFLLYEYIYTYFISI